MLAACIRRSSSGTCESSRWASIESMRTVIPRLCSSSPVRRVSSQATRSQAANAACTRGVKSSRLPIGVGQMVRCPGIRGGYAVVSGNTL